MSSQRPVVSKPIIQHDVMPVIVARRRCEIVERTGVLRSCAEAKSSWPSVSAPVSQKHSQGPGGAGGAQSSGSSGPFWSPS